MAWNKQLMSRTYLFYGLKGISTVSVNIAISFRHMLLLYQKPNFITENATKKGLRFKG
jgi:hypothetical protein